MKKNLRQTIIKHTYEKEIPVGMVWKIKDPKISRELAAGIRFGRAHLLEEKKVIIHKKDKEMTVRILKNGIVADNQNNIIGELETYRVTKKNDRHNEVYIKNINNYNPYDVTINRLHNIEEVYLNGIKLIYRSVTAYQKNVYNGCCTEGKDILYISMDFANNKFYKITQTGKTKTTQRINPYNISHNIPDHIKKDKTFKKIIEYLSNIKNFDLSGVKTQEYLIKYYKSKNLNYPEAAPGYENDYTINKIFKKSLSWKNPIKHIKRETRGYGKKIRKIIFENPWKLEAFKVLRVYIKNLDLIQKYLSNKYAINACLLSENYQTSQFNDMPEVPEEIQNKIKSKIFEEITKTNENSIFNCVGDICTQLRFLMTRLSKKELLEKTSLSGTLNEIDIQLADIAYNLRNPIERIDYDHEKFTNPFQYINNTHWEMKIPETNKDLHTWGNRFHNCVSGYTHKIQSRISNVITFWDSDNPVLCVEINATSGNIKQAYAPCNREPDEDTRQEFIDFVNTNKLYYNNKNPNVNDNYIGIQNIQPYEDLTLPFR